MIRNLRKDGIFLVQHNSKAEMYFRNALDIEPQNIEFLLAIIDVMTAENRYTETVAFIDEKGDFAKQDPSLIERKADIFRRAGEYQKAIEFYSRAIELDKSDISMKEQLGYCYLKTKQFEEAADIFAALRELSDGLQKSHFNKMYGIACLRAGSFAEAAEIFNKIAENKTMDTASFYFINKRKIIFLFVFYFIPLFFCISLR